ncbi:class I SAM-dependent methyltransferase [Sphingosinicella terrae]|uniref:class I SAM-dependent methyltransferase n=1 Tax=Sphingosinicella terrae TaxID=2172047 RepID=UPI000E0DF6DD|nr:methyltransferase domain-containing protein [Sphingosinicella terrae]
MSDSERAIPIYERAAAALAEQYETDGTGADILSLVPAAGPGATALDVGAGSGRDAAALAGLGYRVTAAEPAAAMRAEAMRRHGGAAIEWIDDRLPALDAVTRAGLAFDLVLVSAVWHHVAPADRADALAALARLTRPGGRLAMTLRLGPAPAGQPVFAVSAEEVERLARPLGLATVERRDEPDPLGRTGIAWTSLCLERSGAPAGAG